MMPSVWLVKVGVSGLSGTSFLVKNYSLRFLGSF